MKTLAFLLVFCLAFSSTRAQVDTNPPYKKHVGIAPIELTAPDKSIVTASSLKKNQPFILMYFSPSCDHCKQQINEMVARMKDFSKYQIVLATFQPQEEMVGFYKQFELEKYPNILIGRDTKFLLPPFFRIRNLPYLALYNKDGQIITTFDGNAKVDTILADLKKG